MLITEPDSRGYFGRFGGRYVPETLMQALGELEAAYRAAKCDRAFVSQLEQLGREYVGRPTPIHAAERLSARLGGPKIIIKREDLAHTGAHKINNAIGQVLLAKQMGKTRIIAETGAGQHGVATATACALVGLKCHVYMGSDDCKRQRMNVLRMRLLGAEVIPVESGSRTLKDAINEAIRDWVTNVGTTHYVIGSVVGPHPYPMIVGDFQAIIGRETREQVLNREGRLPDVVAACVGGGSNAIGVFRAFVNDPVRLIGVEAGGRGTQTMQHAATLVAGRVGVLHGAMSYLLQDDDGQVRETHSVSAGLDYPGVGPEHAYLHELRRVEYVAADDESAIAAFKLLAECEGIIPALEPAHALAHIVKLAPSMASSSLVVLNLSGRGDKDLEIVEGSV